MSPARLPCAPPAARIPLQLVPLPPQPCSLWQMGRSCWALLTYGGVAPGTPRRCRVARHHASALAGQGCSARCWPRPLPRSRGALPASPPAFTARADLATAASGLRWLASPPLPPHGAWIGPCWCHAGDRSSVGDTSGAVVPSVSVLPPAPLWLGNGEGFLRAPPPGLCSVGVPLI